MRGIDSSRMKTKRATASTRNSGEGAAKRPASSPPPYRTDRETLERHVRIDTFRGSGPGGQHRNVTDSAVRLTHLPSRIVVTATESRSQHRNRERAFARLIERLEKLNRPRRKRVPTRAPAGTKEERLTEKKRAGARKELRRKVARDAD
ncbi:MAG: peptide chain release factor-like protein [Nitrospirae bacterium]|nr:peptide chain release factor-like protein [Nitrospirota bacterium]